MKKLTFTKSLRDTKQIRIQLTPEESSKMDILAKEAGVTKDVWLQTLIDRIWDFRVNGESDAEVLDRFIYAFEVYLNRKCEEK